MFSCGFYNAINHDRTYSAAQFGEMFDGLITDGVYSTIGECFIVVPGSGLGVVVKSGRAWFNKTWSVNSADLPLDLGMADLLLPRIDTVILEVDTRVAVRDNAIKVIKGTPAVEPASPALTMADGVYQYPLAHISVKANASQIEKTDITVVVGQTPCPFVTGILQSVPIDDMYQQWEGQFTEWFENLKAILEDDAVGNILYQLGNKVDKADKASEEDALAGTDDSKWMTPKMVNRVTRLIKLGDIIESNEPLSEDDGWLSCEGQTVSVEDYPELFEKIGYSYGHPTMKSVVDRNPEGLRVDNSTYGVMLINQEILGRKITLQLKAEYSPGQLTSLDSKIRGYYFTAASVNTNGISISWPSTSASIQNPFLFTLGDNKIYLIFSASNMLYYYSYSSSGSGQTSVGTIADTNIKAILGARQDTDSGIAYIVIVDASSSGKERLSVLTLTKSSYQKTIVTESPTADDVGIVLGNYYYSKGHTFSLLGPTVPGTLNDENIESFINGRTPVGIDIISSEDSKELCYYSESFVNLLWLDENGDTHFRHWSVDSNNGLGCLRTSCFLLPNHQVGILFAGFGSTYYTKTIVPFSWSAAYLASSGSYYSPDAGRYGEYIFNGSNQCSECFFGASRNDGRIYIHRIVSTKGSANHLNFGNPVNVRKQYENSESDKAYWNKTGKASVASAMSYYGNSISISTASNSYSRFMWNTIANCSFANYTTSTRDGSIISSIHGDDISSKGMDFYNNAAITQENSYGHGTSRSVSVLRLETFIQSLFRLPKSPEDGRHLFIKAK